MISENILKLSSPYKYANSFSGPLKVINMYNIIIDVGGDTYLIYGDNNEHDVLHLQYSSLDSINNMDDVSHAVIRRNITEIDEFDKQQLLKYHTGRLE